MNSGIPYFPLDVHLDDKIELIEAEFGLTGFAVVVKLLQRIYGGQGYYCEWTNDVALLFGKKLGLGGNAVSEIVSAAIKRGIFDKGLYDKYHILTSKGIQKRYFEAVSRRKKVDVKTQYLLIKVEQLYKNVNILSENVNILSENDNIFEQRKEEKSKVKESKEDDSKVSAVIAEYENNIAPITGRIRENIVDWCDNLEPEIVIYAIHEAVENNKRNWRYIEAIIRSHYNAGRRTLKEVERAASDYRLKPKGEKDLAVYNSDIDYDAIEKIMREKM